MTMAESRHLLAKQLTREGCIVADPSKLDGLFHAGQSFWRLWAGAGSKFLEPRFRLRFPKSYMTLPWT